MPTSSEAGFSMRVPLHITYPPRKSLGLGPASHRLACLASPRPGLRSDVMLIDQGAARSDRSGPQRPDRSGRSAMPLQIIFMECKMITRSTSPSIAMAIAGACSGENCKESAPAAKP